MIKITELRTYSGDNLKSFDPQNLMDMVMSIGQSLNAIRYYNGYRYDIFIHYSFPIHFKGLDDTETLYFADVVAEDKDRNQERVLITDDISADEVVDMLEEWKEKVLNGN